MIIHLNKLGYKLADCQSELTTLQTIVLVEAENYRTELQNKELKKGK